MGKWHFLKLCREWINWVRVRLCIIFLSFKHGGIAQLPSVLARGVHIGISWVVPGKGLLNYRVHRLRSLMLVIKARYVACVILVSVTVSLSWVLSVCELAFGCVRRLWVSWTFSIAFRTDIHHDKLFLWQLLRLRKDELRWCFFGYGGG